MLTWNDVKGIGPARRASLEAAGFASPEQLAQCLPIGYRDFDTVRPITALRPGMESAFTGTLEQVRTAWVKGRSVTTASVRDDSGAIACVWFAMPWLARQLETGARVKDTDDFVLTVGGSQGDARSVALMGRAPLTLSVRR